MRRGSACESAGLPEDWSVADEVAILNEATKRCEGESRQAGLYQRRLRLLHGPDVLACQSALRTLETQDQPCTKQDVTERVLQRAED